jgi:hypothetical protein
MIESRPREEAAEYESRLNDRTEARASLPEGRLWRDIFSLMIPTSGTSFARGMVVSYASNALVTSDFLFK